MSISNEGVLYNSAENMNYQRMSFLNSRSGTRWHCEAYIYEIAQLAAIVSS